MSLAKCIPRRLFPRHFPQGLQRAIEVQGPNLPSQDAIGFNLETAVERPPEHVPRGSNRKRLLQRNPSPAALLLENIAAGQTTPEQVIQGWLDSDGHCANIMNANFEEMGVALATNSGIYGIYWTQVFAAQ